MFKVLSERQMRRRMGKSARQWKRLKKAERRGTRYTKAAYNRHRLIVLGVRGADVAAERITRQRPGSLIL